MVRVLTGSQVAEERAHEQYVQHLHLKPSSYKFYYKSSPTESQLRKGGPWVLFGFRILCGMDNVLSAQTKVFGVVDVLFLVWVTVGSI